MGTVRRISALSLVVALSLVGLPLPAQSPGSSLAVVVMLDTSISTANVMDEFLEGAEQFLIRMRPADQAKVGSFNSSVRMTRDFTSDHGALVKALEDLKPGNDTRLFDAIDQSIDSLVDVCKCRAVAVEVEYFDGVGYRRTSPDPSLRRLAEDTGGRYVRLKNADELVTLLSRAADDIFTRRPDVLCDLK